MFCKLDARSEPLFFAIPETKYSIEFNTLLIINNWRQINQLLIIGDKLKLHHKNFVFKHNMETGLPDGWRRYVNKRGTSMNLPLQRHKLGARLNL